MKCPTCGSENRDSAKFCSECASSFVQSVETVVNDKFDEDITLLGLKAALNGKYDIIREIGRGGMGIVYECRDLALDRIVALKVLPRELSFDKQFVERFKQEIRLLAKLHHQNIIPLFSADEINGYLFFSMQYIKGKTLAEVINKKELKTSERILSVALQIAQGLSFAHHQNIIHRDLKPENIMINDDDHVYIMDFGIARAIGELRATRTNFAIGTPEYMSPEQCGGSGEPDRRSDLYSYGVLFYEMVSGRKPFTGGAASVIYKQVHIQPEPLRKCITKNIKNMIESCLEKNPDKRPLSADIVCYLLEKEIDKIKGRKFAFTKRKIAIASLLLVVLLISVIAMVRLFEYNNLKAKRTYSYKPYNAIEQRWEEKIRRIENRINGRSAYRSESKLRKFWNIITGKAIENELRKRESDYRDMLDQKEELEHKKEELESQIDEMNDE